MKKMFLILTLMFSFMASSAVLAKMQAAGNAEYIMLTGEPIMPMSTPFGHIKTGGIWKYKNRIWYCGILNLLDEGSGVTWACINSDP